MLSASDKLALSPEGKATVIANPSINNCSFVCYSFLLAFKVYGAPILWLKAVKVRVLTVASKPFTPKGDAGSREYPPHCMALCLWWALQQECVLVFPSSFDLAVSISHLPNVEEVLSRFGDFLQKELHHV